jgi:hypothetical protein
MSVINLINTGTSANSGNGDTLRTAFSKVNNNFLNLERNFIGSGVNSFNGSVGTIQFTATDITNILGFSPYPDSNPLSFVSSSTLSLQNYASLDYVDTNFVTNATLTTRNYITKTYVDGALTEYPNFLYLNNQGFLTPTTLPNYLVSYAKTVDIFNATVAANTFTNAAVSLAVGGSSILPSPTATYNLGGEENNWAFLYLSAGLYIKEVGITIDNFGRLNIGNNDYLGNFHLLDGDIIKFDKQSFSLAPHWYGTSPLDKIYGKSSIYLPNDVDADTPRYPLKIANTGTSGIKLLGSTSSVTIDTAENTSGITLTGNRLKLIGNVEIPLTLKSPFAFLDGYYEILGNHTLGISPNTSEFRNNETHSPQEFVSPTNIITHPVTLKSITNTGTHAPILLKGSSVGLYASYTLDENLTKYFNTEESPGYMVLDNSGLWIGRNRVYGGVPAAITLDEVNQVGSPFELSPGSNSNSLFYGYKLPLTQGKPGQILVQTTSTAVLWSDVNPTSELGTLTANNTATISMSTGGWNHVTADGSIDVTLTNITTGSSAILIVSNSSGGTIYVSHGVPTTNSYNGSPIFSIGNNTTRNVIYRSFGTTLSNVYVSLT